MGRAEGSRERRASWLVGGDALSRSLDPEAGKSWASWTLGRGHPLWRSRGDLLTLEGRGRGRGKTRSDQEDLPRGLVCWARSMDVMSLRRKREFRVVTAQCEQWGVSWALRAPGSVH